MTQQPKRNANDDIDYLKNSHKQDVLEVTVQAIAMADYWIKEAEAQRIRAEAAEQERDKLLQLLDKIETALEPPYFDDVASGAKTFEVRVNDRDYKVGDALELLEYDPETTWLTGRSVRVRVTYILDNPRYVLPGTVIMAIKLEGGASDAPE